MVVHGAQKLLGAFDGPGLDKAGEGFDRIGLTPGKPMAALASVTELGGGLLTATGVAYPAGPMAVMGAMSVATAVHRSNGPMAAKGGYELALTNLAAAGALAAANPGRFRLGPPLPRRLIVAAALGGGVLGAGSLLKLLTANRPKADETNAAPEGSAAAPDEAAIPDG
jgi:putative oxidoreductase